jgi:iron complex outermembrane receptor protein
MQFHVSRRLMASAAVLVLAAAAAPAFAQDVASQSEDTAQVEDIIVTAQKRSQRLQDVPLAVTALSAETLSNSQITGTSGLANLVPSLTYTQSTSDLNNNVRIRGVGTALFNTGLESAVSFVVDGVVMSRQGQGFQELIDIERVEVLRGPQGTLFGKNATAGVVNVVTQRPTDYLSGAAEITAAEHGEYRFKGTIAGPLTDTLGGRLTGFYTDDEGYVQDTGTGQTVYGSEVFGLRGKLEWQPSEDLNLLVSADYRESDSTCCQLVPYQTTNTVLAGIRAPIVASPTNRSVETDGTTFADSKSSGVSLEANLSLGDYTLTSVTGYRTWTLENNVEVDGFQSATPLYVPFGNGYFSINGGGLDIGQFTQELRLTSPSNQPVEYTVGVFYFNLDLDRDFRRRVGGCVTNPVAFGQPCPTFFFSSAAHTANTKTENVAAFGQAEWHLTDQLSALFGARLQRETVSYEGLRLTTPPFAGDRLLFGASSGRGEVADTDLSGKLGLQYQFSSQAQTYLTWSRGYKGRGYDVELTANFATQVAVLPETVEAWELGYKAQGLDGRLSVNTALFYADYQNLQVQSTVAPNVSIPTNAGSSVSKGAEVEFQFALTDRISLSGGVTYADATFDATGLSCPLTAQAAAVTLAAGQAQPVNTCFRIGNGTAQNVVDGRLPNAPKWRGNLSIRYDDTIPGTDLNGFIQLAATRQSEVTFSLEQDPGLVQDGYGLVNLTVGASTADDRYTLSLFVRNLFDQDFVNGMQRESIVTNAANPGNIAYFPAKDAERYVGVSLRANF